MELLQCFEHCFDFLFLRQYRGPEMVCTGYLAEARARDYTNPSALQQFERVENVWFLTFRSRRLNRFWRQLETREHIHRAHRRIRLKRKNKNIVKIPSSVIFLGYLMKGQSPYILEYY